MARSKRAKERQEKVTVYFDQRAFAEKERENEEELEILKKKEEGAAAVIAVLFFFGKPLVIMLLWNMLMPGIFGITTIGYFKALGLYLLARIIIDKND
jgi:hypothetical protein